MADFHLAYVEEESAAVDEWSMQSVDVDYLALVCRTCCPHAKTAVEEVDNEPLRDLKWAR